MWVSNPPVTATGSSSGRPAHCRSASATRSVSGIVTRRRPAAEVGRDLGLLAVFRGLVVGAPVHLVGPVLLRDPSFGVVVGIEVAGPLLGHPPLVGVGLAERRRDAAG